MIKLKMMQILLIKKKVENLEGRIQIMIKKKKT